MFQYKFTADEEEEAPDYTWKADGSHLDDEALNRTKKPKGLPYTYVPSDLDQTVGRHYIHRLFTFDFPVVNDDTVTVTTKHICAGLDLTLAKYPFLTGQLGPFTATYKKHMVRVAYVDEMPGQYVKDTNFEAVVVDEMTDPKFAGLPGYQESASNGMPIFALPGNIFCKIHEGSASEQWVPVFTLKATFLKEGKALVLGFSFQHTIVDGTTTCNFFNALVANMKQATENKDALHFTLDYKRPSLDEYINPCNIPMLPIDEHIKGVAQPLPENTRIISPILIFSAEVLQNIKDEINYIVHEDSNFPDEMPLTDKTLTKQDCLSALIWTAVTEARNTPGTDPSTPSSFRTAVNVRQKLNPPLPDDYWGNMFAHATVHSYHSVMAREKNNPSVSQARIFLLITACHAVKIRNAIDAVTDKTVRERLTRVAQLKDMQDTASAIEPFEKAQGLDFGSLVSFGADLQWDIPGTQVPDESQDGRARFCRKVLPKYKEGIANVLPRRGGTQGDADWEVVVSLREDHARKMILELNELSIIKGYNV